MKKDKKTDQLGGRLRTISADLKLYFEKRMELMMLNAGEHLSSWMAASVQRSVGALFLLGGLCFLLVALAIYIGNLLESPSLGFLLVSVPLLLAGSLFMYLKPRGVFERLQNQFEHEVIKAIEQNENGRDKQKKISSPKTSQATTAEG